MPNIITSLLDAGREYVRSREDDKDFTLLSRDDIQEAAVKSQQMVFPGYGGGLSQFGGYGSQFVGWSGRFPNTKTDWALQVGDPTQSSLVMAAVKWVGKTLPEAPLYVLDRKQGASTDKTTESPVEDHELTALWQQPNAFFSGRTMAKAFALSWIISGNVYIWKIRSARGKISELWYIPHDLITPRWMSNTEYVSFYEYRVQGEVYRLPPEDVIHFRDGIDPLNIRKGLSPLASVLREIAQDSEVASYSATLMRNAGVPPIALVPDLSKGGKGPGDEEAEQIKDAIHRRTTGDERGKPIVLSGPFKLLQLSFNPSELDLKAGRFLPEQRFASVIGIPAEVLGYGSAEGRKIFANMSEAREAAYEEFLIPLQNYIAEELTVNLLRPHDVFRDGVMQHFAPEFGNEATARTQRVAWDLSKVRVLQDDQNKLVERTSRSYQAGLIMRNEGRSDIGKPVQEGGDVYYVPRGSGEATPTELLTPTGDTPGPVKKQFKKAPNATERAAVVEWWRAVAPEQARGLIDATANGHA